MSEAEQTPEEVLNNIDRYMRFGSFTPGQLHLPEGQGILRPTALLEYYQDRLLGTPNSFGLHPGTGELLVQDPFTQNVFRPFERYDLTTQLQEKGLVVPEGMEEFNWAMVEGSFSIDGYGDLLYPAMFGLAYRLVEANTNDSQQLWQIPERRRLQVLRSVVGRIPLDQIFDLPFTKSELIGTINGIAEIQKQMIDGNIEKGQRVMESQPQVMAYMGAYLFGIIKSGLVEQFFPGEEGKKRLTQMVISLAKAECAPKGISPSQLAVLQSRFASYLNLCLDGVTCYIAPNAFALGNKSILDELKLQNMNYMTRVRTTRCNLDLGGFGLHALDKVLAQEYNGQTVVVTTTHKSVYTSVSEVLNLKEFAGDFHRLCRQYGYPLPDERSSVLAQDFIHLENFSRLLERKDPQVISLAKRVYEAVRQRQDMVRGSLYVPDEFFNAIISQAGKREGITVKVVLNAHNASGSHGRQFLWGSREDRITTMRELNIREDSSPLELEKRYYDEYRGQYPYAAFHLVGPATYSLGLYRNEPKAVHATQLRVVALSDMEQALHSRIPFKGINSGHSTGQQFGIDIKS